DEHTILENANLDAVVLRAHDHGPVDALATREELRLGDDGAAAAGIAAVTTSLLLGLEPRRTLDALWFVARGRLLARLTDLDDSVRLAGIRVAFLAGAATSATTKRR